MEERPVDVVVALVLMLLVIGFLGFLNPSAVIPGVLSVHPQTGTQSIQTPSHKIRIRRRTEIDLPPSNEEQQKAVKAVLVLMLGLAPNGG